MKVPSLFGGDVDITQNKGGAPKKNGLYASTAGTGPDNETCKTCKHLFSFTMAKTYYKCLLVKHHWTHGSGTDVKVKTPACDKWETR